MRGEHGLVLLGHRPVPGIQGHRAVTQYLHFVPRPHHFHHGASPPPLSGIPSRDGGCSPLPHPFTLLRAFLSCTTLTILKSPGRCSGESMSSPVGEPLPQGVFLTQPQRPAAAGEAGPTSCSSGSPHMTRCWHLSEGASVKAGLGSCIGPPA